MTDGSNAHTNLPKTDLLKTELSRALLLSFYFFTLIAAYYFLKPLSRSLYITYVGSENLPYVWIATTLTLSVIIPLFQWRIKVIRPMRIIVALILSLATLLAFFRYKLDVPGPISAFTFFILIDVYSVLIVENLWSLTNSSYQAQSGKRWYGIIASGGMLGGLAGSFGTSLLIRSFGVTPLDLILVSILVFLLSLLLIKIIFELKLVNPELWKEPRKDITFRSIYSEFASSAYLRALAGILFAAQLIEPLVEYQFMSVVEREIQALPARTSHVSDVFALTSSLGLFVNIVLLPLLHIYAGVGAGLFLQPVLIGILSGVTLFWQSLSSVSLLKIVDRGLSYSSGRASRELLYVKFDSTAIYKLKGWIDIYGYRLFRILGSLMLLAVTAAVSSEKTSIFIALTTIFITLTWGAFIVKLTKVQ